MSKIFILSNDKITMETTEVNEIVVVISDSRISITAPGCDNPHHLKNLDINEENCIVSLIPDFSHEIYKVLDIDENTHYLDMSLKVRDLFTGKAKTKVNKLLKVLGKSIALKVVEVKMSDDIRGTLLTVDRALSEGRWIVFNTDNSVEMNRAAKFCRDAACHVRVMGGAIIPQNNTNVYIDALNQAEEQGLTINEIAVSLLLKHNRYSQELSKGYVKLLDDGLDFNKLVTLNKELCEFLLEFVDNNESKVKETMLKMALNIVAPRRTSELEKQVNT